MIPTSSVVTPTQLLWSKIPGHKGSQLTRNGEPIASVQRTGFWSSEFQADSPLGNWRIRRSGFLQSGAEMVDQRTNASVAIFHPNWSGRGSVALPDGQTFKLSSRGCWRPVWTLVAPDGQPVLSMDVRAKTVECTNPSTLSPDRLIMLAVFVWRIVQQTSEDAAAVVAATG